MSLTQLRELSLENIELFGSGTVGLLLNDVDHVEVSDSQIRDCTEGLLNFFDSTNILIKNTDFMNSRGSNLISFSKSVSDVILDDCTISGNLSCGISPNLFFVDHSAADISLTSSKINNNRSKNFINDLDGIKMKDNTFDNNSFRDYSDKVLNEH